MPRDNNDTTWGTETQYAYGPPPPFRFDVHSAEFNTDMRRKGAEDILHLVLDGTPYDLDTELPIEDWEEWKLELKCGNGWETLDGGKTAEHPKRNKPDGRTRWGIFINRIVTDNALKGLFRILRERGESNVAENYEGISIVLDQETSTFRNPDTGEVQKYGYYVPVDFLGEIDSVEGKERQVKKSQDIEEQLKKLALESDDHDTFQAEAMGLGIKDSKLLGDVMDDSEEGYYARTRQEEG